jgi:hypothetical protein
MAKRGEKNLGCFSLSIRFAARVSAADLAPRPAGARRIDARRIGVSGKHCRCIGIADPVRAGHGGRQVCEARADDQSFQGALFGGIAATEVYVGQMRAALFAHRRIRNQSGQSAPETSAALETAFGLRIGLAQIKPRRKVCGVAS